MIACCASKRSLLKSYHLESLKKVINYRTRPILPYVYNLSYIRRKSAMASPPKPWERAGVNRQMEEEPFSNFMSSGPAPAGIGTSVSLGALPAIGGGDAPAVPAKPSSYSSNGYSSGYSGFGSYSGYGSPYSSMYGSGGYGMYGSPYGGVYSGSYGGMFGGYNRFGGYGMNQNEFNSFARLAEEHSRPAFQSIESIVGAFSSVSMMLDSTFQAVYNSFRAVVGVADNFGRMKTHFAQIFAALAVFKWLKYLYRKLLVFLRLRPQGFAEDAWQEAGDVLAHSVGTQNAGGKKSSWPVVMFFAIVMGGPWLIWKFLQSTFSGGFSPGWANGSEDHFVAQAMYDFSGQGSDELSFKTAATIHVAPKEQQPRIKGWLLASVDGQQIGLIPANYVKVLGKRRGTNYTNNQSQLQTLQGSRLQSSTSLLKEPQNGNEVKIPSRPLNTSQSSQAQLNPSPSAVDLQSDIQDNRSTDTYTNQELDCIFDTKGQIQPLANESDKS